VLRKVFNRKRAGKKIETPTAGKGALGKKKDTYFASFEGGVVGEEGALWANCA